LDGNRYPCPTEANERAQVRRTTCGASPGMAGGAREGSAISSTFAMLPSSAARRSRSSARR